jgi:hypothetical protein
MDQDTLLMSQNSKPMVKKSQIWEYLSLRFLQYFLKAFAAEPTAVIDSKRKTTLETELIKEE